MDEIQFMKMTVGGETTENTEDIETITVAEAVTE